MFRRLLVIFAALASATPAFAGPPPSRYMDVALLAETTAPRPGSSVLVGLKMTPHPGWHGYWSNAGESGLSPTVRWSARAGVGFGPLLHPAPTLLRVMGLTSFVHAGMHILIARMKVDRDVPLGASLPVTADVNFAVCSDRLCVPQRATLTIQMITGDAKPSGEASLLKRAFADQPKSLTPGVFEFGKGRLTLQLPAAARLDASRTHFFPDENGFFDALRARAVSSAPLRIVSPTVGEPPRTISGVVSDGSAAFKISFRRGSFRTDTLSPPPPVRQLPAIAPEVPSKPRTSRPGYDATADDQNLHRGYAGGPHRRSVTASSIAAAAAFCTFLLAVVWVRRRGLSRSP